MEIHESPGEVSSFTPKTLIKGLLPYDRASGQLNKIHFIPFKYTFICTKLSPKFSFIWRKLTFPFYLVGYNYATNLPSKPHTCMVTLPLDKPKIHLHTALPYITWGLVWDLKIKKEIPIEVKILSGIPKLRRIPT